MPRPGDDRDPALQRGELDKVVLTQRNQMRAVLLTLERYAELERNAAELYRRSATLIRPPYYRDCGWTLR